MTCRKFIIPSAIALSIMSLSATSLPAQDKQIRNDWILVTPFADAHAHAQHRNGRSQAARPRGNIGIWVHNKDYPVRALREKRNGGAALLLTVTSVGRVKTCIVTRSSGHDDLDRSACKNVTRRARFVPELDYEGDPVEGLYPLSVRFSGPGWAETGYAPSLGPLVLPLKPIE